MKKNDESVSEEELQKTIATLISLNRLGKQGIGTISYFIPFLPNAILATILDKIFGDFFTFSTISLYNK